MTNFNKSDYRTVSISQVKTDQIATYYVHRNGKDVIRAGTKVSNGTHRSANKAKTFMNSKKDCYMNYSATLDGKSITRQLTMHRLVAAAWLGLDFDDANTHVHHINGCHQDNRVENLMPCSPAEHRAIHRAEAEAANAAGAQMSLFGGAS